MTPIECAINVADFLDGVFKNYVPTDGKIDDHKMLIRSGFLPKTTSNEDKAKQTPCMVIRPTEIIDSDDSIVKLLLLVTTYNKSLIDGHLEIYHILEMVRQSLLKKRMIASKYRLELPLKTIIPEDQPFPLWWGYMEMVYTIGQPQEEPSNDDFNQIVWEKDVKQI